MPLQTLPKTALQFPSLIFMSGDRSVVTRALERPKNQADCTDFVDPSQFVAMCRKRQRGVLAHVGGHV